MSTLSRADGSQMAEERIMEEQQKGRSSKKTKKKKKGVVDGLIPYSARVSLLARLAWVNSLLASLPRVGIAGVHRHTWLCELFLNLK